MKEKMKKYNQLCRDCGYRELTDTILNSCPKCKSRRFSRKKAVEKIKNEPKIKNQITIVTLIEGIPSILVDIIFKKELDVGWALKKTVEEFLETKEGKRLVVETNYDFNWGDAFAYISNEMWQKNGLDLINVRILENSISYNHDEVLCQKRRG